MYERFTDRSRKVMQLANQEAQQLNHEFIGTEHILLGLLKEEGGVAGHVLRNMGLNPALCRTECLKLVQPGPDMVTTSKLPQTPRTKQVIENAILEARNLNHSHVGTEHLLLGLLSHSEGIAAQVLLNLGLHLKDVRAEVLNMLGYTADTEEAEQIEQGKELREQLEEWLLEWVGERHDPVPGCYNCDCWEAFDTIFRHVE
jgi:ATP-dependent Clp protease ATP-binding subunit ClpC